MHRIVAPAACPEGERRDVAPANNERFFRRLMNRSKTPSLQIAHAPSISLNFHNIAMVQNNIVRALFLGKLRESRRNFYKTISTAPIPVTHL
jgi:hypothetical protein